MKKIVALILAVLTFAFAFVGCSKIGEDGKGAIIDVYMGTKTINLDPATAYTDENSVKLISLIYQGLVSLDENGKVKKELARKWEKGVDREGNAKLTVWINDTYWSDGSMVQANDVVYAWKRILKPEFKSEAASLLYAIQGARDAKTGAIGIDDIGLYSLGTTKFEIVFEEGADIDEFIYNMASPALVPLRENKVEPYAGSWSYSSRDLSTNGPFRLKKFTGVSSDGSVDTSTEIILERSKYFYLKQDVQTEAADKYVTPYRIVLHFTEPLDRAVVSSKYEGDDIVTMYANEDLFYISNLTAATAAGFSKGQLNYSELASTYSYLFNTSNKALSDPNVRYALSLAFDRTYVAELVGCKTEAATSLMPSMIFDAKEGSSFQKKSGDVLPAGSGLEQAQQVLAEAGVKPASFGNLYLYYRLDEANDSYASAGLGFYSKEKAIATYAKEVWEALGFKIVLKGCTAKEFEDAYTGGKYDIIGVDYQMLSPYALYNLAAFSTNYGGNVDTSKVLENGTYQITAGISGYNSEEYNALIEQAWNAGSEKEQSQLLHQAEEMLLKDGAIAPIIFNTDCYVASKALSGIKTDFFGSKIFTKTALKDYEKYLETNETPVQ